MRQLNDKQVEIFIGQVLRAGMLLSCAVTFIGLTLYLLHHSATVPAYHVFHPADLNLLYPSQLFHALLRGIPQAIIEAGILLLIATPVARVAFLVGAFALERDRMYVAVSGLVLAILLYSIFFFR